ncbi:hypothetical protein [Aquiflexum lacus]|uniref:hypothetical protein n=1 Tax=Aquiflexum lacus TaxID=2483805 RepID=UPI001E5F9C97|nr:hypothetical protein [Aquiflexum lacus]
MNFNKIIAVLFLFAFSCSQKEDSDYSTEKYPFQIIPTDSITVDNILAALFLFQNVNKEHIFFRDAGASKIFVFDRSGNLVNDWTKSGDVPGAFSMIADNLVLTSKGDIVVSDNLNGVKVFSLDGTLLLDGKPFQYQTGIYGDVKLFRKSQVIRKSGHDYLLHHLDLMDEVQTIGESFYKRRKNLLLTSLSTGESSQHLYFPTESKFYQSGKAFPFEDFRPAFYFEEEESKLYLIFQNEPVLYEYDWSGYEPKLTNHNRLDLEGFHEHEGWDYNQIPYGKLNTENLDSHYSSKIYSLEKVGDYFLINYKPGPPKSDVEKWKHAFSKDAPKNLKEEYLQKAEPRTVVVKDGEIISQGIHHPKMHYDSYGVIDDEIWWMKPLNKDKEDESYTIYKGKLKEIM